MDPLWDALGEAIRLLTGGDPETWEIILLSLQV
jgi:ABC-type tungstate transport system substrate-binding protein